MGLHFYLLIKFILKYSKIVPDIHKIEKIIAEFTHIDSIVFIPFVDVSYYAVGFVLQLKDFIDSLSLTVVHIPITVNPNKQE